MGSGKNLIQAPRIGDPACNISYKNTDIAVFRLHLPTIKCIILAGYIAHLVWG